MRFHSLEKPPSGKAQGLAEKVREAARIKPRLSVIWPLDETREEALRQLKEEKFDEAKVRAMINSGDVIERRIGEKLSSLAFVVGIGQKVENVPKNMIVSGKRPSVLEREGPEDTSGSRNFAKWLLSSRKPLFATEYPEELRDNLVKIEGIVSGLRKEFGDSFVGVQLFGSTAKGYWAPESDLDFMVIADQKDVFDKFEEELRKQSIAPCPSCVYDFQLSEGFKVKYAAEHQRRGFVDIERLFGFLSRIHKKRHKSPDFFGRPRRASLKNLESKPVAKDDKIMEYAIANLFNGIFLGDHRALLKLQAYVLENLTPEDWDRVRSSLAEMQTNLRKIRERHGISDLGVKKIEAAALILRIPPAHEQALQILRSRLEKENK